MNPIHCRSRGFTLIELLVVIAIIAILIALLLPFLEQGNIYSQIDFNVPVGHPNNATALLVELSAFRCPSDLDNALPALGGATNYFGNKGAGILWGHPTGPNASFSAQNGVLYHGSRVRIADITDGTSNTAAIIWPISFRCLWVLRG